MECCKCNRLSFRDGYCKRHLRQTCVICFENVPSTNSAQAKRLSCGHSFHFRCILRWFELSDDCPVCRKPQGSDDLVVFKNNIEDSIRKKYNR